jgi:lipopolysaccharide export system protein LptA
MTSNLRSLTSSTRIALYVCVLAFALAGQAPSARAEKADRDKPINFQGDRILGNTGTKEVELIGNVVATQGTLIIHADRVKLHQNPDNSMSATAYGNPVSFREKRDGVDEYYEGFAQRVEYDGSKQFVELFDRALLKKSGDEIRSNYISYNSGTNVLKAEGRPDATPATAGDSPLGPRVRGVFLPQPKEGSKAGDAKGGDAKSGDAKGAKPADTKSSPPLPLKPDSTLNTAPSK